MTISRRIGPHQADSAAGPEIRAGNLGVRLARSAAEIDAGQALRYQVFYEELGANAPPGLSEARRDRDAFDAHADHLLVIDHDLGAGPQAVVGTYRLLDETAAAKAGGFYSSAEFDLTPLAALPGRKLELGRSCVAPRYRGRAAMQLLWRGIASYVQTHHIDLMFGCASLPGTDPEALSVELSYLYHAHLAPPALRLAAQPARRVEMLRCDPAEIDHRRALASLPPLIKGYLRLGGFVGDGAVIDHDFNTVDVAVVVKSDLVTDKYYRHYDRQLRDALY